MAETAFHSDDSFTQQEFGQWLTERPRSDINHYELLNGRIVMTPPAGWPHGRIEAKLVRLLDEHTSRLQLGIVLGSSTGFDLPSGDTVEPDVSFISWKKLPGRKVPRAAMAELAPDLAIEIISRGNTAKEMDRKLADYFAAGVQLVWYVYPVPRQVKVYSARDQYVVVGEHETLTGGEVLPGFSLSLREFFAEPSPDPT